MKESPTPPLPPRPPSNSTPPPPPPPPPPSSSPQEMKGWLAKWTNYIKGYQQRWFVLNNGLLSYYRNASEMARTCRGTINLHGATIHVEDALHFVVSNGGGTQTFHLRASSEVERQRWVTALEIAKARAIHLMKDDVDMDDDDDDYEDVNRGILRKGKELQLDDQMNEEIDKQELFTAVKSLSSKLGDLQTCYDLIVKHCHALQRTLAELETADGSTAVKNVNERATLFKITSNAMIKASADFLDLASTQGKRWVKVLANERENRQKLEDMVEQMAKQHSHLEIQVQKEIQEHPDLHSGAKGASSPMTSNNNVASSSSASHYHHHHHHHHHESSDEDEFVDAIDEHDFDFTVPVPPGLQKAHRRTDSSVSSTSQSENAVAELDDHDAYSGDDDDDDGQVNTSMQYKVIQRRSRTDLNEDNDDAVDDKDVKSSNNTPVKRRSVRKRRNRIPDKPNISFSLWSIMKNCIGKDLTKIPVPVNFAEPLSMLQRLVEDFEYSEIIDKALNASNDCEQMLYVAAFTVSAYSTTAIRVGKPFNPLLGETYECDRSDDRGFRSISEQVSHHPPMVAQYCESVNGSWKYWQEFTMRSKFKGKYLEVEPLGIAHLEFTKSGNHYTWRKVRTLVHNFVLGKLWIDQMGEMEIINHRTGDKCHMKFEPYSYFGGCPKKVTGTITSGPHGSVEWVLNGTWDSKLEGSKVFGETKVKGKSSLEIGSPILLWKVTPPPVESEKYYNFSTFACELNEPEVGVAPTDSRLRPDQRLMEDGEWDEANKEKVRLEEKQRAVRRQREMEAETAAQEGHPFEGYTPIWFKKEKDFQNGEKLIHIYQGGYWDCKSKGDWTRCPDIF